MKNKAVEDAVQAMIGAAIEIKRLTAENQELLKETFELAGRNEKLKYKNEQLVVACKQVIELAEWLGTPPGYSWSEVNQPVKLAEQAIKEAENG